MSAGTLDETAGQLLRHGLAAETPAVVVENATTDRQRVIKATLSRIAAKARSMRLAAPAILFVGETVALAGELAWFEPGDNLYCNLSAAATSRVPIGTLRPATQTTPQHTT